MPRKVRELIRDLERAGFQSVGGKKSHRKFVHPESRKSVMVSGGLNDDVKPYQEQDLARALKESGK